MATTHPHRTSSGSPHCGRTYRSTATGALRSSALLLGFGLLHAVGQASLLQAQETHRPPLHGQEWMAITGKPLAATAGAITFQRGGNAVDAAATMLAATATMWDVLSWGGETQALIYNPHTGEVLGLNALGVAPSGATPEFFHERGMHFPPATGPLAAVTPGTPGGLMVMVAEWGRLSLAEVLEPAIRMADGYPMEAQTAGLIVRDQDELKQWRYSRELFFPHLGSPDREAPYPGEIFRQSDLAATLRKLVEAEALALAGGASRRDAIMAAYDRFYRGDIAEELVRGTGEEGGLITMADLDAWEVKIEEPVSVNYRGIDVYKLTSWTQGPALLQALNILENADLQAMGYNSVRYLHTLYQAMNLAFADRDFYYSDPAFDPQTPIRGLLSKEYARERWNQIDPQRNDPGAGPGDPYPFQGEVNPFRGYLEAWEPNPSFLQEPRLAGVDPLAGHLPPEEAFTLGTTSVHAADAEGWVVSIVPSGGWIPAVIAGRTGVGLSQRMQSFVTDPRMNPYNVVEPGKRPRVTLTPSLALKDGRPLMAFGVQGGDGQDQNLLQFFLNMVEFDMTVQEAVEAANMNSSQMRGSFGSHVSQPGRMLVHSETPSWVRRELEGMGYDLRFSDRTSGPITAIWFDWRHNTMWGGASHHGEDYGVAW